MKRCWVPAAVLMTLLAAGQAQVIASPSGIDQPDGELAASTATAPHQITETALPLVSHSNSEAGDLQPMATNLGEFVVLAVAAAGLVVFFWRGWHRLHDASKRPAALSPLVAFALLIGMLLMAQLGAVIAVRLVGIQFQPDGSMPDLTLRQIALLQLGVYGGQSIIVAFYLWLRSHTSVAADRTMPQMKAALIGAAALLIVWPAALSAAMLFSLLTGQPADPIAHDLLRQIVSSEADAWFALVVGLAVLAAPIFEEITYRGILQHGLVEAAVPRWLAIAFTSAIFAMMHLQSVELHAIAALFVLSMGFGYVYEKTGRLIAPIVMHVLFNAGNLAMSYAVTGA